MASARRSRRLPGPADDWRWHPRSARASDPDLASLADRQLATFIIADLDPRIRERPTARAQPFRWSRSWSRNGRSVISGTSLDPYTRRTTGPKQSIAAASRGRRSRRPADVEVAQAAGVRGRCQRMVDHLVQQRGSEKSAADALTLDGAQEFG